MTSSPAKYTLPFRGCTMPNTVFSVVDLPEALPPSGHELAGVDLEAQALKDVDLPVIRVHAVEP